MCHYQGQLRFCKLRIEDWIPSLASGGRCAELSCLATRPRTLLHRLLLIQSDHESHGDARARDKHFQFGVRQWLSRVNTVEKLVFSTRDLVVTGSNSELVKDDSIDLLSRCQHLISPRTERRDTPRLYSDGTGRTRPRASSNLIGCWNHV